MARIVLSFFAAILLALGLGASAARAQSRVFVAAQGSDSNPCTFASPCRTFQHAHNVVAANGETAGLLGVPAVRVPQQGDQFAGRLPGEVEAADRRRPRRGDAVDPSVAAVPVGVGVGVSHALFVEVADVHGPVGPGAQVRRAEPGGGSAGR